MPIAFSRSLRSLQADGRSRRSIWFLLIPVVALAAWTAWFLEARVTRYESTDRARVEAAPGGPRIVAEFPASVDLSCIRPGRPARFVSQSRNFPAHVNRIDSELDRGSLRVELAADSNSVLQPGLTGSVEIQVERVSPATLLLRAARQTP